VYPGAGVGAGAGVVSDGTVSVFIVTAAVAWFPPAIENEITPNPSTVAKRILFINFKF
jgi:hypothetical protein